MRSSDQLWFPHKEVSAWGQWRTMLLSRKERAPRRQAKNTARSARGNLRFEGGALADGKFTYAWFEGSKCTGEAFAKLNGHLP